jgi:hypothetical protein
MSLPRFEPDVCRIALQYKRVTTKLNPWALGRFASKHQDFVLLGYNVMESVKVNRRLGAPYCFHLESWIVGFLHYVRLLYSSEMLADHELLIFIRCILRVGGPSVGPDTLEVAGCWRQWRPPPRDAPSQQTPCILLKNRTRQLLICRAAWAPRSHR